MRRFAFWFYVWPLTFIVISSVIILNLTGFCYPQLRYCSDRDLLDIAVQTTLNWREKVTGRPSTIMYPSTNKFYEKNPNCCLLYRQVGRTGSIWARGFGFYVATAEVWYQENETEKEPYYYAEISLSACGLVRHKIGTSESHGRPS
jgi:hypothetical protein